MTYEIADMIVDATLSHVWRAMWAMLIPTLWFVYLCGCFVLVGFFSKMLERVEDSGCLIAALVVLWPAIPCIGIPILLGSYVAARVVESKRSRRSMSRDEMKCKSCGCFSSAQYCHTCTVTASKDGRIAELRGRLAAIADIIETGDQRLLAHDGPCGGLPPDIRLIEWRWMYLLATGEANDLAEASRLTHTESEGDDE